MSGRRQGFTLLELMLAITILAAVSGVSYMAFSTVTRAWKRGQALTDAIHHGDYVLDQLVMALRSAYFPDAPRAKGYGLQVTDESDGPNADDRISWVKLGGALVGQNCPFADSPHRIEFTVKDHEGQRQVAVKAWRILGQPEDFDPSEELFTFLSRRVTGFDCRCALKLDGKDIDWEDEWEDDNTNKLPKYVELTLYLTPVDEGREPVELKRIVELPAAPLSWH